VNRLESALVGTPELLTTDGAIVGALKFNKSSSVVLPIIGEGLETSGALVGIDGDDKKSIRLSTFFS